MMASIPGKTTDLKKSPTVKTVLSPSNTNAVEKTSPKTTVLKSPTAKVSPKLTTVAKNGNDLSKTNGTVAKKMETTSPSKVVRSPSAKSITPPSKTTKTSPSKSNLERSNSQGDTGSNLAVKTETAGDNSIVNSNGNCDVILLESQLKDKEIGIESANSATEENVSASMKNGHTDVLEETVHSVTSLVDDTVKGDCVLVKDKPTITAEQNHASGDNAFTNEKVEAKDSVGECDTLGSKNAFEQSGNVSVQNTTGYDKTKDSSKCDFISSITSDENDKIRSTEQNQEEDSSQVHTDNSTSESKIEEPSSVVKEETSPELNTAECSPDSSATDYAGGSAETTKLVSEPEVTKQSFRLKVWEHLEKNDLVVFPRPCKGRIPNFKGAPAAAEKLKMLDIFKNSKTIKINPDKAQEMARFHTLEFGKRLLVPVPRLRENLFQAVIPPAEASEYQLRQASQRYGMKKWGKPISPDDHVSIDLIVLGSVVVDKKGHRIGKGEGFADLEFAMLVKMNAVNENTVIVTTVHDDQIYDELPEHLFKEHDVPVDWIITPTQVIEIQEKLPRPSGIIWSILSNRRLLEIPILQKLREEEMSAGHDCTLKEVDSDVEEKPYVQRYVRRKRFLNYSQSTGDPIRDSKMYGAPMYFSHQSRRFIQSFATNRGRSYGQPVRRDSAPLPRRRYDELSYQDKPERMNRPMREPRSRNVSVPNESFVNGGRNMNRPRSRNRPLSQNRSGSQYGPRSQIRQQRSQTQSRSQNRPRSQNRTTSQNRPRSQNRPTSQTRSGSRTRPRSQNRSRSTNQQNRPQIQINHHPTDNNAENGTLKSVEVQTDDKKTSTNRAFLKRKRAPIEFSLRVRNIGVGVRVRDLKVALSERGVKPRDITWRGYKGFAFLHFVKPVGKENTKPLSIDEVMATLQGLTLQPKDKRSLVIEPINIRKPDSSVTDNKSEPKVQRQMGVEITRANIVP